MLVEQDFYPSTLGMFTNPFYFARKGIYENIKLLSHYIDGKVLDVGCGKKPYQKLFKTREYIGMDVEQSGHTHKNEDIDIYYDGNIFPFEDNTFDSAISNEVLEHVFNPNDHLKEICRVLKPNGKLLISVPFLWDEHEQPYDYARYSSFGLCYLLENNGFKIIEHKKSVSDIRVIFQMINTYIHKKTTWLRKRIPRYFMVLILNAPFNIMGELFGLILPKNDDLYLDNIIVATKV